MAKDQAPETTDELRRDIDSGKTGDKVDWPDPAASPLGTDDEAAGNPPDVQSVRAATPDDPVQTPMHNSAGAALTYVGIAAGLLIVMAAIVFYSMG